jgi:hypothetical protein
MSAQHYASTALPPRERALRYPLDKWLGKPQSRPGRHGEEKNLGLTGTRTPTPSDVQPVASSYTDYDILRHSQKNIKKSIIEIEWKKTREFSGTRIIQFNGGYCEHGTQTSGFNKMRVIC